MTVMVDMSNKGFTWDMSQLQRLTQKYKEEYALLNIPKTSNTLI